MKLSSRIKAGASGIVENKYIRTAGRIVVAGIVGSMAGGCVGISLAKVTTMLDNTISYTPEEIAEVAFIWGGFGGQVGTLTGAAVSVSVMVEEDRFK